MKNIKQLEKGQLAVVGIPFDLNASFMRGSALAPAKVREVLDNGAANMCTEEGVNITTPQKWVDVGDMRIESYFDIEDQMGQLLLQTDKVISIGGDHSIAYPIMLAYSKKYPNLNILQIDAHTDLYHDFEGDLYSHACPFARIMESNLAKRLIQVGIRSVTPHTLAQAEKFNVIIHHMRNWKEVPNFNFNEPVYLSLDLDALDPAFAPGVSHHEPGGLSTREVLQIIHQLRGNLVGADIVELNPKRDYEDMTAMVAAKFLRELIGKMI